MDAKKWMLPAAAGAGAAAAFTKYYPAFGRNPGKAVRTAFRRRTRYYDGKHFYYPEKWKTNEPDENRIISPNKAHPAQPLPAAEPAFSDAAEAFQATWFGHSGILLRMGGKNILADPVFSKRCSPFQWVGPKRFTIPTVTADALPHIDLVLLTHDHYDHLDPITLKAIAAKADRFLVPLGVECHLRRWGIPPQKTVSMAWWEQKTVSGIRVTCLPANHFSGRKYADQNYTLWCSYMLRAGGRQVFFSGDGGFGRHFRLIRESLGAPDLAVMECGMYNRKWHEMHMYPEESVKAAGILGAKAAIPVHWGAFVISTHPWDDPPERFVRAAEAAGLCAVTPMLCETADLTHPAQYQKRWWRHFK